MGRYTGVPWAERTTGQLEEFWGPPIYPLAHYGQNMVLQLDTSSDLTPPRPNTPGFESPPQQSSAPVPAGGCTSPAVSGSASTLGHAGPDQGGGAWERARESRGQWKGVISSPDPKTLSRVSIRSLW